MNKVNNIGQRIKKLLKEKGISQAELARRIGVSRAAVSEWVRGKSEPSESTLKLIAKEFGVNENWLKTGEGEIWSKDRSLEKEIENLPEEKIEELLIAVKIIRKIEKAKRIKLTPEKRLKLAELLIDVIEEFGETNPSKVKNKAEKLVEIYM